MKKDLNTLIESFFLQKENVLNANVLENLIRKQFDHILKEDKPSKGKTPAKPISVSYSYIPEIPVSEIGWSTLETPKGKTQVPSAERRQLQQYLDNIKGNDLKSKITSINSFFSKSVEDLINEGIIPKDSKSSRIQSIISYLVFLKTLTTIITNFNASSAGFSYESFLAVLLGGKQIPAGSGGGIADILTGDGTYMSLKLYAEDSVDVGGSFSDLINDIIDPKKKKITYIVSMKSLSGEGLQRSGTVTIYKFDFNINNVMKYLAEASTHSKECIRLPKGFIKSKTDFSKLKKVIKPKKEIEKYFASTLENAMNESEVFPIPTPQMVKKLKTMLAKGEGSEVFYTSSGGPPELGLGLPVNKQLEEIALQFLDGYEPLEIAKEAKNKKKITEIAKHFAGKIKTCYEQAKSFSKGTNPEQQKEIEALQGALEKTGKYAFPEESLAYYETLSYKEKVLALKNCQGYINVDQFSISKPQMFKFDTVEKIGEIVVGRDKLEKVINDLASAMNQEVFEIFESLANLTTNINKYFATGLKDDAAADIAQEAATNIDKKTEKIQKQVSK